MKAFLPVLAAALVAGSFAFAGKISSSSPSSSGGVVVFDGGTITTTGITVPETAGGTEVAVTIPSITAGRGPMLMDFCQHVFDGANDPIWSWGYNTKCNGTVSQSGEPGFHTAIEGHYRTGGVNTIEWYAQYTYDDGASYYRPFHFMINKATHRMTAAVLRGNPLNIVDDLGVSALRVSPGEVLFDADTGELNRLQFTSTLGMSLESGITATAGDDEAFYMKSTNTLSIDNNTGDERLLTLANGTYGDIYGFKPGGRLLIIAPANNSSAGIYTSTPNGKTAMIRQAGSTGEMFEIIGSGGITTMNLGYGMGTVQIGDDADELIVADAAVTVAANVTFKHGTADVQTRVAAPASASSTCTAGQEAYDSSYFYKCTATNTWKRVAIATW